MPIMLSEVRTKWDSTQNRVCMCSAHETLWIRTSVVWYVSNSAQIYMIRSHTVDEEICQSDARTVRKNQRRYINFMQLLIYLNKLPGADNWEDEPHKMSNSLFNCCSSTRMINIWDSQEHSTVAETNWFWHRPYFERDIFSPQRGELICSRHFLTGTWHYYSMSLLVVHYWITST